jgi:hypothetical protein
VSNYYGNSMDFETRRAAPRPIRSGQPAAGRAAAQPAKAKAKSVIQIWMWGGPAHVDTLDPKPAAGYDYCGPFAKPIPTNVSGIEINELLPCWRARPTSIPSSAA